MANERVYAEIDLDNLVFNVNNVKNKTKTPIMAVVKTDAYGHGAVACAKALAKSGITDFAVATCEEAIELRENGIDGRILILGYVFPSDISALLKRHVCLTVFDLESAKIIDQTAEITQVIAKIHLKIDTGMGRLGFLPNGKSISDIVEISKLKNIKIDGAFTHFACADMKDKTYTKKQIEIFQNFLNELENAGIEIPTKHACNSAAAMDFDGGFFDMVRSGIINYGLYPSDEVDFDSIELRPVMSIISHISYVKEVEAGTSISYGSTFTANKKMKIATVPVGYGDGYPRSLSNCGRVLINGKSALIKGRICMDQFMVDVTEIPDVKRGDKVTLVGTDCGETITVEELSQLCGRFNYEFVCDINKRVPRVYKSKKK